MSDILVSDEVINVLSYFDNFTYKNSNHLSNLTEEKQVEVFNKVVFELSNIPFKELVKLVEIYKTRFIVKERDTISLLDIVQEYYRSYYC